MGCWYRLSCTYINAAKWGVQMAGMDFQTRARICDSMDAGMSGGPGINKKKDQGLLMGIQEPKYKTVYNWVVNHINSGELKAGDRLPSENELSARFGLSRQTIRHAIDLMEQQKLVTRIRGSGTYVGGEVRQGRRERYMNIAVISTYVDSYVFPTVLREIESVLSGKGYTTQIAFTGNRVVREQEILSNLIDKDIIDGLIVEPAKSALPNPNLHYYRELMKRQIPILFFNSNYPELGLPYVAMDDVRVGRKAVEYLVKAGHRRIGGIFKCDDGQGLLRYKGFMQGMQEAGLRVKDGNVVWIDSEDLVDMEYWQEYLFCRIGDCSALVCYNDEVAYILSGICKWRGIRIPDQLSLIGIDNSELSTLADVQITSLPYPMEELGRKAAENIVKMIGNPCFDGNHLFDSDVVERDSVKILGGGS